MIMGNFLNVRGLRCRMAARTPAVGLAHPTVVPTNFDAESETEARGDEGAGSDR